MKKTLCGSVVLFGVVVLAIFRWCVWWEV